MSLLITRDRRPSLMPRFMGTQFRALQFATIHARPVQAIYGFKQFTPGRTNAIQSLALLADAAIAGEKSSSNDSSRSWSLTHAVNSLEQFASAVGSMIVPTAYAESDRVLAGDEIRIRGQRP